MKWSEEKPPQKDGISYNHATSESPLGLFSIEWKSWKECPSYDVFIGGSEWVTAAGSLDDAKAAAERHVVNKYEELREYLSK